MRSIVFGAVAVLSAVTLSACANGTPAPASSPVDLLPAAATSTPAPVVTTPAAEAPAAAAGKAAAAKPKATKKPVSNLSELKSLGIDVQKSVLIDVADDGQNRYLSVGKNSVVDFHGTKRTDNTMMFLQPAQTSAKNRVVIKPPFYNEDLGAGYCVADTKGAAMKLETCKAGKAQQIFELRPAGDSGQFELHGMYGVIRVDNGKITTNGKGRVGLQTILYAN
ncbi:hypothetical protein [Actinoplanes couchii]|uniref:Ricin B lectin domain-containing protein n=1 Tax=Actinoplanes couchii TaxID=403638 RepID=A0ABQ3XE70_9ACTN|nr:hypothetical protein [Actinoplanes couchii]MDR6317306.1 hypothetical protein [Actinoplanes couchii]GID56800.1 hypothetical protein Aco03nite_052040 [Actinoplanes couchii]